MVVFAVVAARWRRGGGAVAVRWWRGGGAVVARWWRGDKSGRNYITIYVYVGYDLI